MSKEGERGILCSFLHFMSLIDLSFFSTGALNCTLLDCVAGPLKADAGEARAPVNYHQVTQTVRAAAAPTNEEPDRCHAEAQT